MRSSESCRAKSAPRVESGVLGREVETNQLDEVLVQRILQPDDDAFDIYPRICHLHGFMEFHVISPSVADRSSAQTHSHDPSGIDAPSLPKNPASPAKAGAHGRLGSRLSPGKLRGGAGLNQLNGSE